MILAPDNVLIYLQYVLPLLNVIVLLTVKRKVRLKLAILMLTIALNLVGLYMLSTGSITDEKTHSRAIGVFTFFTIVELLLLFRWSRKSASADTQKEDARNL
ncbi:MAG: hypothetical protein JWQ38_2458 [Flavipsychrobacter sp.]|nr:hypothetical protein [Flavipsychrobacter sp.]